MIFIRLIMEMFFTYTYSHSDEYWQGTEIAYNMVYGGVDVPWEWRPKYRIRNTLHPMYLSIPLRVLKLFGLDY